MQVIGNPIQAMPGVTVPSILCKWELSLPLSPFGLPGDDRSSECSYGCLHQVVVSWA
jgi:hypothetical protein